MDATQDQRPHDAFAQLRLGDHQGAQAVGRHDQGFDLAFGADVDQRRLARKLCEFGREFSRPHFDDRRYVAKSIVTQNDDLAGQNHAHARAGLAGSGQKLTVAVAPPLAEAVDAPQFGIREHRMYLRAARLRHR